MKVFQALPETDWALMITDVRTPGVSNGLQLALSAHEKMPQLAIIVTSGYYDQMNTPLPDGITFLLKPWALDSFLELVTTHLARHSG